MKKQKNIGGSALFCRLVSPDRWYCGNLCIFSIHYAEAVGLSVLFLPRSGNLLSRMWRHQGDWGLTAGKAAAFLLVSSPRTVYRGAFWRLYADTDPGARAFCKSAGLEIP